MTTFEMDRLFAVMPAPEAQRVLSFVDALGVFEQASDKRSAAKAMSARLAPFGYRGLSYPSLMRKLQDFKSEGVWAFVPAKYKRVESRGAIRNEDFVEYWQGLCLENRRKVAPAWKKLVRDFCAGVAVPGVGTWQEMFFRLRGRSAVRLHAAEDNAAALRFYEKHGFRRLSSESGRFGKLYLMEYRFGESHV